MREEKEGKGGDREIHIDVKGRVERWSGAGGWEGEEDRGGKGREKEKEEEREKQKRK